MLSQTNGGYFFFQNIYNQKADYGRCISDVASALNGFVVYDLRFGHHRHFARNASSVVNQVIATPSRLVPFEGLRLADA